MPGVLVEIPEAVSCSGNCRETTGNETEKMGLVSERKRGINEETEGISRRERHRRWLTFPFVDQEAGYISARRMYHEGYGSR